ncbi:MAG: DUF6603 domain-containing protein [Bacteroidota bacterium]
MSLTALSAITLPNNAEFTLDEATIGADLSTTFFNFLGQRNPVLTSATGTYHSQAGFIQITGTFKTFINFPGVLVLSADTTITSTSTTVGFTLFLFDVDQGLGPERHCVFLTTAIDHTNFTVLNLLKGFTNDGSAPGFMDSGAGTALLSLLSFADNDAGTAKDKLLFSSLDFSDVQNSGVTCPLLEVEDTKTFFSTSNQVNSNIRKGLSFYLQPKINIALLTDIGIEVDFNTTVIAAIAPDLDGFQLLVVFRPGSNNTLSLGSFTFTLSTIKMAFSLGSPTAIYPSIDIKGTAAFKTARLNYWMQLSLGEKTVSVKFTNFPSFGEFAAALKNGNAADSFDLQKSLGAGLPIDITNVGDAFGTITIESLRFRAAFGAQWQVHSLGLSITTSKAIAFLPNIISILPSFNIQLQNPFQSSRTYRLSVSGLWTLGSGTTATQLLTSVTKNGQAYYLSAGLANGSSINIHSVFSSIIPHGTVGDAIRKNFPQVSLLDVEANAYINTAVAGQNQYEVEITTASDWILPIPGTKIGLTFTQLDLGLTYTSGRIEAFNLEAWLNFAQVDLQISGSFDADEGWSIQGSGSPGYINFANFFKGVGDGKTKPQTDDLSILGNKSTINGLTINGLMVSYRQGIKTKDQPNPERQFSFYVSLDVDIPIIENKLALHSVLAQFEYQKVSTQTQLTGSLFAQVDLLDKSGEALAGIIMGATKEPNNQGFTFSGSSAPGQNLPIGQLIGGLAAQFGISDTVPDAIANFTVDSVSLTVNSKSKDFTFSCHCLVPLNEDNPEELLTATVDIALLHDNGTFINTFKGVIDIGGYAFELDIESKGLSKNGQAKGGTTSSLIVGMFANTKKEDINLHGLIANFSEDLALLIPEGFNITLEDLFFARYKEQVIDPTTQRGTSSFNGFLIGADIDLTLSLNDLPLIGKKLPADASMGVHDLKVVIASQNFKEDYLSKINPVLQGQQISPLPVQGEGGEGKTTAQPLLPKGLSVACQIQIGDVIQSVLLSTGQSKPPQKGAAAGAAKRGMKPEAGGVPADAAANNEGPASAPPAPAKKNHGATWIPIQKDIGPLHFERIGAKFKDGVLSFLLDASMKMAGLTVELSGLTFGSPIKEFDPYFDLHGLVVDYKKLPALEIGGGLLKADPPPEGVLFEYDGAIIIRTKALSIVALGSYAKLLNGAPSLFVYLAIGGLKVGPPWFIVTGLSAGFGVNRKLVVPDIDSMESFPLVSEVIYSGGQAPKKSAGGQGAKASSSDSRNTLMAELEKLKTFIPPSAGAYFIAVGLKFTTFKIVDAFALVVVQFGHRFRVDLFGKMFIKFPPAPNGSGRNRARTLLVNVSIDMHAYLYPDEGVFGLEMDINEGSYIYSELCQISGRLALKAWFAGDYDGDFVFVMGGYHDLFKVPDHYPSRSWLKPLSLQWKLSDDMYIKGSFYFAMTPSALMAGGDLEANFQIPHFRAYFHLYADFIIFYKPFHYDAKVGVDLDIRAGIPTPFGDIDIHLTLSADLHIWGPDFSGKAHVSVMGIGFSVSFGAGASALPPIPWTEFKESFLPPPEKIFSIVCEEGLVAELEDANGETWWLINKSNFSVAINSTIPFTSSRFIPDGDETEAIDLLTGAHFGILPMQITPAEGGAALTVIIQQTDGDIDADSFAFAPRYKNIPVGLWGDYRQSTLESEQTLPNRLAGLQMVPGKPPVPGETFPVPIDNLKYDSFNIQKSFRWEASHYFKEASETFESAFGSIDADALLIYEELSDLMDSQEQNYYIEDINYTKGAYVIDPKVGILD